MSYIPLHVHTHYSLQLGISKPKDIIKRCKTLGIPACAITDTYNIAGTVNFYKSMVSAGIKPLLGSEIKVRDKSHIGKISIIAKNTSGWKNLIKITSASNNKDTFDKEPLIDLDLIPKIINEQNLICITGYYESLTWKQITDNNILVSEYESSFLENTQRLISIFGEDNFFIERQMFDNYYNQIPIMEKIKLLCDKHNINRIAGIESYYCDKEDSADQKILICSKLKTTLPEISKKIINNTETGYNHFFSSENFYILDNDTINELYDETEIQNTKKIADMCEDFSPLNKPMLPNFNYPSQFDNSSDYLRHLCREGWRKKIQNKIDKTNQNEYVDRIKNELTVLDGAGLSSYFLIVRDILEFVRKNNWLAGPGRGSAAGCLVSYLIDITNIDRFYNVGRNTKDRISMPDIDVDVPIDHRDDIIQYIKDRYGEDKVGQMITFNTLKGKGALKEVLRVYGNISFEEMNNITKHIPDEAKIADELQEAKDEDGDVSIIKWSLENYPEKFKEWCEIDEHGNLSGPLAKRFEQAIRIEGTKFNQSKHAAGIAISAKKLGDICPMIFDTKTQKYIAGLEMNDLEALGVIKFDILGIALLDKIMFVNSIINKEKQNAF
jgi:DNA polymerase-3 subunit alpha